MAKLAKFFLFKHLQESGEGYFGHLAFTLKTAFALLVTAIILLIHGLLPFTFTQTASKRVAKLSKIFENRVQHIFKKNDGVVNYAEAI